MDVARLLVQVDANTAQAEAGLARLTGKLGAFALGAGVLVVAAAAVGVASVKMAGDFQAGLTTLVTSAGESERNLGMIGDAVKQMAVDTGTSTKQLIAGLYMINSAGYRGKEGLDVLAAAAKGARAEHADLNTVADATTTIMRDYPGVMNGATGAVNYLIGTVKNGKTHLQDLSQSLAMVLPTASVASIGLADVMGAMATMTARGVPAANAATYLRQTILGLIAPSGQTKKALADIGLTTTQVATEMQKSLPGALEMIYEALKKKFKPGSAEFIAELKDIAGGAKVAQGMMILAGQGTDFFAANVKAVSQTVKDGGKDVQGWADIQGNFNFQMSKAREMLETAFITLGQKLLPKLTEITKYITGNAIPAVQGLTKFYKEHEGEIKIVAILIGGALTAAMIAYTAAALAAAAANIAATWEFLVLGAAIAALVAGVIWAYNNWGWFHDALITAAIAVQAMGKHLGDLLGVLGNVIGKVGDFLHLLGLIPAAEQAIGEGFPGGAEGFKSKLPHHAGGTRFTSGGAFAAAERGPELLLTPGVYSAPRGSTVLSAQDTAKVMGGSGKHSQTINIYPQKADLDSDDLARHLRRAALLANTSGGY